MVDEQPGNFKKAPPDRGASSFIYPPTPANLDFFAEALKAGHVVAIPTETVYGLAAVATDEAACRSVFAIKGRPLIDPLIVHVHSLDMASEHAETPPELEKLARFFWPGPLTVVLRKKPSIPDIVTAGKDTVAIRMPRHPATQALLERIGGPLAAPSANPFGYVSPSLPRHVADSFGSKVPFILDGGPCEIGLESTILDLAGRGPARILRPGAISREALSTVLKRTVEAPLPKGEREGATGLIAPGGFASHYSPRARMDLFPQGNRPAYVQGSAILFLSRPEKGDSKNVFWLSEDGNPQSMGRNLFALLRKLDTAGFTRIHCELPDAGSEGIHLAIRDRLLRAAAR